MENTSLRDPIRSATFIGPSRGQPGRMVGPSCTKMQDEIFGFTCAGLTGRQNSVVRLVRLCLLCALQSVELRPGSFPADDIVTLDHRRNTHASIAVFRVAFHPHNSSESPHENFGPMRDLGWQG